MASQAYINAKLVSSKKLFLELPALTQNTIFFNDYFLAITEGL